ncbi:MAG: hypothetical protein IH891_10685 [Planctomycetes bacterium]|nr:hypothetical protein [Planctomycetota bacterium]
MDVFPGLADADPKDLREILIMWHTKAEPYISGENDWTDSYAEFVYGWERARVPKGENPLRPALVRAEKAGPPVIALQYPNRKFQLLIALCRELQLTMGSTQFWLTWEDAGELLKIHPNTAGKYLNMLVFDGILKRHPRKSERDAFRYNYLPPMEN